MATVAMTPSSSIGVFWRVSINGAFNLQAMGEAGGTGRADDDVPQVGKDGAEGEGSPWKSLVQDVGEPGDAGKVAYTPPPSS